MDQRGRGSSLTADSGRASEAAFGAVRLDFGRSIRPGLKASSRSRRDHMREWQSRTLERRQHLRPSTSVSVRGTAGDRPACPRRRYAGGSAPPSVLRVGVGNLGSTGLNLASAHHDPTL